MTRLYFASSNTTDTTSLLDDGTSGSITIDDCTITNISQSTSTVVGRPWYGITDANGSTLIQCRTPRPRNLQADGIDGTKLDIQKLREIREIKLPDGTLILLDDNGNYRIEDKNAKVVYEANRHRSFNRFVNASDILEEFIEHVGRLGVSQRQFMALPIELFINFLIIRAAEQDGEQAPDLALEKHPVLQQPKCRHCGRFITKKQAETGMSFCNESHMLLFVRKTQTFLPSVA